MKAVLHLLSLLAGASIVYSLPSLGARENALPSSFASEASQLIATQLLKHNKDIDANQVYSPLGVATILATLAEGADGETYAEFGQVFGFPKERQQLRAAFEQALAVFQKRDTVDALPSFQTWFYVYRNNSVREDYKQLLQRHYYAEVKDINREESDWQEPSSLALEGSGTDGDGTEPSNSKDVIGFETLKRINVDDDAPIGISEDSYGEEVVNKEASKFDREVDDKQYVEKPVALAEAEQLQSEREQLTTEQTATDADSSSSSNTDAPVEKLEKPAEIALTVKENVAEKQQSKRSDANAEQNPNMEENETVQEDEKLRKLLPSEQSSAANQVTASEPEKVRLPLQKLENAVKSMVKEGADEIMIALESHLSSVARVYGGRSLFRKDDIACALSANAITGRANDAKTKMLLFNGLYFHGSWRQPFYQLRDGSDEFFFMTNEDAMKTPMMHARGKFNVSDLPHLKARLLSLPYENDQYSLCIVLPNEPEGLSEVIAQLEPSDYKYAREHILLKELHVTLPKFQVMETSRSEAMLKQMGLKRLFSRTEAQLNLMSEDEDLHIDEIVQFVSVRVDEDGSSTNSLSAANIQARSPIATEAAAVLPVPEPEPEPGVERFDVNRPFAYFIVDCRNQVVLASGKVYAPESVDELPPVSIEVELEQS
ncbi:PREDICTED: serpin B13 [Drosophila arizonae]|uniref:Serpin B13 n=1 Tax=Drosophila arizonae TaxID=7263 RepID=A0ABM1NMY6_DROAR|nr:PREDICTED: serpin B13 [Drosophila arizonae]